MDKIVKTLFLFLLFSASVFADNLSIKVGEKQLKLPYWPAREAQYGAIVMVRGGENPQWSMLLAQFAERFAQFGWSVVLLNSDENHKTPWIKQLPKVLAYFRDHQHQRIVMIHYGDQLHQSFKYFNRRKSLGINGLVMLSAFDAAGSLEKAPKLSFPLFDIAGQFDYEHVLNQREVREKKFKPAMYHAVQLAGAHHDYEYNQKQLLAYMHGWMIKLSTSDPKPPALMASYIEPAANAVMIAEESNWEGYLEDPEKVD